MKTGDIYGSRQDLTYVDHRKRDKKDKSGEFEKGDKVYWIYSDKDIPKGTYGIVQGWSNGKLVVRFHHGQRIKVCIFSRVCQS